jgi:uncharacterized protein YxjI
MNDITGIDLSDSEYTVVQSIIRNKYRAEDSAGNTVLRAKQNLFQLKEKFPFVDDDGTEVFTVEAEGILDVAGDYMLVDSTTEENIAVLDNDFSLFQDTWKIRDPDSEAVVAELNSRGALVTLVRNSVPFANLLIPTKYEITDSTGNHVGDISGRISLKDKFDITIDNSQGVPTEPVIAACMVIDAIQNN